VSFILIKQYSTGLFVSYSRKNPIAQKYNKLSKTGLVVAVDIHNSLRGRPNFFSYFKISAKKERLESFNRLCGPTFH
jgi:hypothetical protein